MDRPLRWPRVLGVAVVAAALSLPLGCGGSRTDDTADDAGAPATTAASARAEPVGELRWVSLEVDGRSRRARVYVPSVLSEGTVPLVLGLHGGGGSAEQFAENSDLDALAEANGFIVAYPEGIPGPVLEHLHTWNAGYCCGPAQRDGVDDVAFIAALLDTLEADLPVDVGAVYAIGHSNGGMMAYRLACELADRIVAIGVVGASLGIEDCAPSRPVSVMHVHGSADRNHPIDGGPGQNSLVGVDFHPAVDGVRTLARADGCPATPRFDIDGDLTVETFAPCDEGAEVRFVAIAGASHAWPGGQGAAGRLTGPTYDAYDASGELWAFVSAHTRGS